MAEYDWFAIAVGVETQYPWKGVNILTGDNHYHEKQKREAKERLRTEREG